MNKNAFKCRQTLKGKDLVEYSSKMFLWVFYQNPFFLSTGKYGGTDYSGIHGDENNLGSSP